MPAREPEDTEAVRASLIASLVADQRRGALRTLEAYLALYPGYEALVTEEYARIPRGGSEEGPPEDAVGETPILILGHYRVLAELGRGGQGVVYLAEDAKLHRKVALKVLNLGAGLSEGSLQRFRREAEVASRLDHPAICPVYEVGEEHGLAWIAMRFVEGETLAQRLAAARAAQDPRAAILETLHLIEQSARALHAAHEAGVVHRDIKPGNLMVTPAGDPVILDFGLAREVAGGGTITRTGERFGTPAYMSPEQLSGQTHIVDRRTDVWSLGVTLYECLTLRTPFEKGPGRESTERAILRVEPPRARRLNPQIPRDLAVVLSKALEKDPTRRYPTALALAEELRRVCEHEPIEARPAGVPLRLKRWTQRNPLAATFLGVLALGLAVSLFLLALVESAGQETEAALRRSRALALATAAARAAEEDPRIALALALEAEAMDPGLPEVLSEVHRALAWMLQVREWSAPLPINIDLSRDGSRLATAQGVQTKNAQIVFLDEDRDPIPLEGHTRDVYRAIFSPDQSLLLTASRDGTARLWSAEDGRPLRCLPPHPRELESAAFSPDGTQILTGCLDGIARLWTLEGELIRTFEHLDQDGRPQPLWVYFSPLGDRILTHGETESAKRDFEDRRALLWDLDRPEHLASLEHGHHVYHAAFSHRGDLLVTCSRDGMVRLWNGRTGLIIEELEGHESEVSRVVFSQDDQHFVTASHDSTARLWTRTGKRVHEFRGHEMDLWKVDISSSLRDPLVITGADDCRPRVWNFAGLQVAILRGHRDARYLTGALFVPGQHLPPRIVTCALDGTVRLWNLWNPDLPVLIGHRTAITHAAISPDGGRIATGAGDGEIRLWDREGRPIGPLSDHQLEVMWVEFSPGGEYLASAGLDGTVRIWNLREEGSDPLEIQIGGTIWSLAFHPTRPLIVVCRGNGPPRLYDLKGRQCSPEEPAPGTLWGHAGSPVRAVFSPQGDTLLVVFQSPNVSCWDLQGKLLKRYRCHDAEVSSVVFHPQGDRFLSTSFDGQIRLRDLSNWTAVTEFSTSGVGITAACFSPCGTLVATAHTDGAARLWNLEGDLLTRLPGHSKALTSVTFTRDGKRLLTSSFDGTARLWMVDPTELLEYARRRNTHALTEADKKRYLGSSDGL